MRRGAGSSRALAVAGLAALALAAGVAGCGEREERLRPGGTEPLELMLDYFPNADHAPIYAAQAGGHFRQAGLKVKIRQPSDPSAPIKQVAAGRVDLAISYEPEVLRARDRGLNVVSVGALVQKPLTSIVSLPEAGIRRPADLEGKRVGTAGIDYQSAYLKTILRDAGVPARRVDEKNLGFSLTPALLTRRVDAVLGAFWNYEGVELRLRGKRPQVIRMERAGVPSYNELVVVANADSLDRDAGAFRAFLGALGQGTRDLRANPDRAVRSLLRSNPDLDPRLQREAVKATLPVFSPPRGRPYGYQDPPQWRRFTAWMRENGLLRGFPNADEAFTNDLLPGQGL